MKKSLALVLMLCMAAAVFAEEKSMAPLAMPTARSNGMGGTHIAYTDNVFALLVNPAAMMRVERRSFFALSPMLLNPQSTFKMVEAVGPLIEGGGDMTGLGNVMNILSEKKGKIALGVDIREFPFSIAWVSDGFGFGLWDRIFVAPEIHGMTVRLNAYADFLLPIGFAFKILDTDSHTVDAGITLKPFVRAKIAERIKLIDIMSNNTDIMDNMSAPLIAGAGFDLGFLYRWDIGFSAGLTLDDIVTRGAVVTDFLGNDTKTYFVPFTMNLGVAYDTKLSRFFPSAPSFLGGMGFTFAFDWHDMANAFQQDDYTKRNAVLNLGMGLQVSMFDMIMLRIGMNEMLPAVGVGFNLGPLELDVAYYGKEFGNEPGLLPTAALDLTIALRPSAKKRNWPWTRGSLVGFITGLAGGERAEPKTAE